MVGIYIGNTSPDEPCSHIKFFSLLLGSISARIFFYGALTQFRVCQDTWTYKMWLLASKYAQNLESRTRVQQDASPPASIHGFFVQKWINFLVYENFSGLRYKQSQLGSAKWHDAPGGQASFFQNHTEIIILSLLGTV